MGQNCMILRTLSIGLVVGLGLVVILVLTGEQEPRTAVGKASSTAVFTRQPQTRVPQLVTRASNPPWDANNGWLSEFARPLLATEQRP